MYKVNRAMERWRYNANRVSAGGSSWAGRVDPAKSRQNQITARQIKADLFDDNGELKLARRHRADHGIVALAVALSIFGVVIIYSIASGLYGGNTTVINREMLKRGIFLAIGVALFIVASRIPLNWWKKAGPYIFLIALLICLALPILGAAHVPVARCALGACRWYKLGAVSFQPAEFLKLGTVLFMAGYLSTRLANGKLNDNLTLVEVLAVMLVSLLIIVGLQRDMGTGAAIVAIFLIELVMSGMSWRKLAIVLGVIVVLFAVMTVVAPHRMSRIFTFTKSGNADSDYHINQALIGLGSGGLTGRGLGQSVQAFGWLPEAVNDSIFAIVGETLGFVGTVGLIATFAFLIMRMFSKTNYLNNMYLRLVVAGVVGWLASHVLANVMAMTHLIPLTGITLPLVSSGGTSAIFVMISLGVVFEISCYTAHRRIDIAEVNESQGGDSENPVRRRRQRWSHSTDRRRSRTTTSAG